MSISDEELVRTESYNDYLRPQDFFHSYGGIIANKSSVISYVTAMRPKRSGTFGETEMSLMGALLPHLERAVYLHRRIVEMESQRDAAAGALDRLQCGCVLVDGQELSNCSAEAMLRSNDGLIPKAGDVQAANIAESRQLRSLILKAATTGLGNGLEPGDTMLVSRRSANRPYMVGVLPLSLNTLMPGRRRPAAAVFISDPEEASAPGTEALCQLFGPTPAEARVAALLVEEMTPREIAEKLSVSFNTVRTHLQRILDKTGVRRQVELVRLLLIDTTGLPLH